MIVIFVFFIFRILAIKFSPGVIKISKDTVIEYEDERNNKKVQDKTKLKMNENKLILIVEDEEDILELLEYTLQKDGLKQLVF